MKKEVDKMERLKNLKNDYYIKVGKTSITIKDEKNKTRGVIRGINTWDSLQFNQKVDWNIKLKLNIKGITDKLIFYNNKVYYLFNKRLYKEQIETIKKLKDIDGYNLESCFNIIQKLKTEEEFCKNNNIDILYVNM